MNMVEEPSNTWIWCSRIVNRSIEHKQITKSDIRQYDMLEGRLTQHQTRTHICWSENDQQMWSHAVASDLSLGEPKMQTVGRQK